MRLTKRYLGLLLLLPVVAISAVPSEATRSVTTRWRDPSVSSVALAFGQTASAQFPEKNPARKLDVVADGSRNPELISDERAYTHFLLATIGTSEKDVSRREALLKRVGLAGVDREAYTAAAADLGLQLPVVTAQRAEAGRRNSPHDYETSGIARSRSRSGTTWWQQQRMRSRVG